jgi:hypothetical protein
MIYFINNSKYLILFLLLFCFKMVYSQTPEPLKQSYLFFPYPMDKKWHTSLGATFTNIPDEVTEEARPRVPAGDLHLLRKINSKFAIDGRLNFQVIQNHLSVGPRYINVLNDRFSFSVGNDIAWWFGYFNFSSFDTKANGWINYPNISVGYKMKKQLLVTLKGEAMITLYERSTVGKQSVATSGMEWNGYAGSLILEQPLYKNKSFILGFKGQYTNFFWQTWPLFPTFNKTIFYPEVIAGFIL